MTLSYKIENSKLKIQAYLINIFKLFSLCLFVYLFHHFFPINYDPLTITQLVNINPYVITF